MTVKGEVIESEYSSYWGSYLGKVKCPDCKKEITIQPIDSTNCECGYSWEIEVNAVGQKEEHSFRKQSD